MSEAYLSRGVSPTKDDVKKAVHNQEKGLFPGAFCKIIEDIAGDNKYCMAMHADGAGTKSILAYLYFKETGNYDFFKGIAQDSLVMNTDDLVCVGAVDGFLVSNTIGRNAHRIDGTALARIIEGYDQTIEALKEYGVNIVMTGGETADVGDIVSTVIVDSTVTVRFPRSKVIDSSNIGDGDVIVGLASFGQAKYEKSFNSGIGSNGLTAARHLLLSSYYAEKYPESYSHTIEKSKVYCGSCKLTDRLPESCQTAGEAILSPTRTYLPVMTKVLGKYSEQIHGIVHCTGGGQVKCKSFGKGLHYIKDNLFDTPAIFKAIQKTGDIQREEMYQVFNMGHRMEVYCKPEAAGAIMEISESFGVEARIVGRVEKNAGDGNKVTIVDKGLTFEY
jgi:phosphoribosylformylglycinamidine cyclo-ligase